MSLTKLSLAGNDYLFPARESLVSDIPAGHGKSITFFYSVEVNPLVPRSRMARIKFMNQVYFYAKYTRSKFCTKGCYLRENLCVTWSRK